MANAEPDTPSAWPTRPRAGLTRRRLVLLVLLVVVAAVLVFAWQAYTAATALYDARRKADRVEQLLTSADFGGASRELASMQRRARTADDATDGILWDLGRHLPWVGRDIGAVQTSASVVHRITTDNAPIALELSRAVDQGRLKPRNGRIDLAEVRALAPDVHRAAVSIAAQRRRMDALDVDRLTFPFQDVVRELADQVDRAGSAARSSDIAFRLLPRMLGAGRPRTYLLMIENNAEIRSTGGMPGSVAVLRAENGHVAMGFQGSARDMNRDPAPVDTMPAQVRYLFGDTVSTDFRDITFDPNFPDVARTAAAMLRQEQGIDVDGVLSVDPVTLALMLRGTGPVPVAVAGHTSSLTSANAVPSLLNLAYQVLPTQTLQDDFFKASARAIFDRVLSGRGNERLVINGMASGAAEHRVLLWSRHPAEERLLRGSAVAGEIGDAGRQPRVGFYLTDATAGKPEFYLHYYGSLTSRSCEGGAQVLSAALALRSSMPSDYDRLSEWITGNGQYVPRGTIGFNLRLYGPGGGEITTLTVDGRPVAATGDRHERRQVAFLRLRLRPGQQVTVRAQISTARGQTGDPRLDLTPGIDLQDNGTSSPTSCG